MSKAMDELREKGGSSSTKPTGTPGGETAPPSTEDRHNREEQLDRIEETQRSILEGQIEILKAVAQLLEDNECDESLEMQHQRFKREAAE